MFLALSGTVAALLVVGATLYGLVIYNGLVSLRNELRRAWSNIDVLLKQRQEELPNLVEVCQGYARHEKATLEAVTRARARIDEAQGVRQVAGADRQLRDALQGLFAVVEGYPDLKADQQFLRLQGRITELEDAIADRRELYNEAATALNIRMEQLPDVLIARPLGFERVDLWSRA